MNKKYIPLPIDVSDVHLPDSMQQIVEQMAENVHETWAAQRVEQGWSYGEQRDDAKRKHPCLVPYNQLSEEEREYDRSTAISTLKYIIKMGYKIEKK